MSNSLQRLELAVPVGSLASYIHWVNQVPMLTAEEEYDLAKKLHEDGDLDAAKKLVVAILTIRQFLRINSWISALIQWTV